MDQHRYGGFPLRNPMIDRKDAALQIYDVLFADVGLTALVGVAKWILLTGVELEFGSWKASQEIETCRQIFTDVGACLLFIWF